MLDYGALIWSLVFNAPETENYSNDFFSSEAKSEKPERNETRSGLRSRKNSKQFHLFTPSIKKKNFAQKNLRTMEKLFSFETETRWRPKCSKKLGPGKKKLSAKKLERNIR